MFRSGPDSGRACGTVSVDLVFLVVDAFAVFAMALIAVQYLRLLRANANAQLLGVLCLAAVCHVVLGRYQPYGYWISEPFRIALSPAAESILNLGRNVAPGVFLFLSHSMLRDGKRLPKALLVLFVVQLLLEEPVHFVVGQGFPAERLLTEIVPTLLQSVFAGWAIFWIVAEWPTDLIEARRGVRFLFLLVVGVIMLSAGLLQRIVIPASEIENYYVHMFLIGVHTLVVFVVLVRTLSRDSAHLLQPRADHPEAVASDTGFRDRPWTPVGNEGGESERPVDTLVRLLEVDHVYRRPKPSVRSLADELGLPEYRLRKLIHEELGFRNFNAYLHHYRLREGVRDVVRPGAGPDTNPDHSAHGGLPVDQYVQPGIPGDPRRNPVEVPRPIPWAFRRLTAPSTAHRAVRGPWGTGARRAVAAALAVRALIWRNAAKPAFARRLGGFPGGMGTCGGVVLVAGGHPSASDVGGDRSTSGP